MNDKQIESAIDRVLQDSVTFPDVERRLLRFIADNGGSVEDDQINDEFDPGTSPEGGDYENEVIQYAIDALQDQGELWFDSDGDNLWHTESVRKKLKEDANSSKKMKLLQKLADVLHELAPDYEAPLVSNNLDGKGTPLIAWDGPFEWVMITGGSSLFSGESGNYSTPTEPEIQQVLDEIQNQGIFLEPINSTWLGAYDA